MPVFCRFLTGVALALAAVLFRPDDSLAATAVTNLPSDTPARFQPQNETFDYVKREEMIPMRDGVISFRKGPATRRCSSPAPPTTRGSG
jgi:hypothetical protein